jgi:Tfp pilus tip-associated adhesin PilY1
MIMKRNIILLIIAALFIGVSASLLRAGDDDLWTTVITPDAVIIQDLTGSMAWLPNGKDATFYLHGANNCTSNTGPYYTSNTGPDCHTITSLFAFGNVCTTDGPYSTSTLDPQMPRGTYWVVGNVCTSGFNGPYTMTKGERCLNIASNPVWGSGNCTNSSTVYYTTSGTGHTMSCTQANMPTVTYISSTSNCTTGPFYRSSASGRLSCTKTCQTCADPFNGSAGAYSSVVNDCSDATGSPFYRTSGTGHTHWCPTTVSCAISTNLYTEGNCNNGPFYKTSGTGHTTPCYVSCNNPCTEYGSSNSNTDDIPWSATDTCDGPFYTSSATGRTNCSKIAIAKRALFNLLDYNADGNITSSDNTGLGMRLGLMRYYNCSGQDNYSGTTPNTDKPWNAGCEKVIWPITVNNADVTTPYANIYCNSTSCASTVTACTGGGTDCVAAFSTSGGTPLADSIKEAKLYLDYHKSLDPSSTCRQKSIIVVTDGADTYACGGNGSDTGISQRRSPIYYAKQAAEANYKVYVVGFGAAMSDDEKNTLNWMAYFGGTRNPNAEQTGDTTAITVGTNPCSNGGDPHGNPLSGYAFMASNPTELIASLQSAITSIQEATYSFSSQASVAAARVQEENYIYEASFEPKQSVGLNKEPFWTGHLKKYQIGDDGALITPHCWDAGAVLRSMDADDRNILTYKSAMTDFTTSNITAADLAVADNTRRNEVVGFYRGEATYNLENWKLGDLFHTNPIIVKTPNLFFSDPRECGSTSYSAFRSANVRTAAAGTQRILVGANDGQLHAFHTGTSADCASGGNEVWSFIPPNLLQKISPVAHNVHSTDIDIRNALASHDLTVDGPIQVADAWIPSADSSGISKSSSDWKTIAIFGQGQGSGAFLWSPSSTCYSTSAFSATYSATTPYYCGLYALNVTNSAATSPTYMWHLMPTSAQAPYLGEAWSKAQIGRVKIAGNEKWVAFVGGGYSGSSCLSADGTTSTTCNTPATGSAGKGFFVVDLRDGSILWSYTHADNGNMDFAAPASPYPADLDNDGFIDTVYMGDLGGNMWRFRLCSKDAACASCGLASYTASPCTSCTTSSWSGSRLFSSTSAERGSGLSTPVNTHKQIFTSATATKDTLGNVWVYFGTGEVNDPTSKPADTSTTKNRIYGIREDLDAVSVDGDAEFTHTYTSTDLINVTSPTSSICVRGWYINLSSSTLTRPDGTSVSSPLGEKMISDPTVFGGMVYFATYVPNQVTGSSCGMAGDSFLYKIKYVCPTSAGDITNQYIGHGEASSVLVSYRPGYTAADIYITASGGAGTAALTQDVGQAPHTSSMTNILYWKDRRLQ